MPRRVFQGLFALFIIVTSVYLLLPSPRFPVPPPGALQSIEPADTESIYRRSYYTDYSRSEILAYYKQQFSRSSVNFPLFQIRLNYPPEEAQTLIRDQTRSSWLEEIVHPGRESLYVNGFYPTKPTEQINLNGVHYGNKITLKMVPSHPITRLTVLLMAGLLFVSLVREYAKT